MKARQKSSTKLEIRSGGQRLSIGGPALAVIALVAVLGVIWIAIKLVDLNAKALGLRDQRPLPVST